MDKQDKTAEDEMKTAFDEMQAKAILLKIVPKDCYWEDMNNLTNTPIRFVIEAMQEYAQHRTAELEAKIKALEERLEAADEVIECTIDPNRIGTPARLALEKYNSLKQ